MRLSEVLREKPQGVVGLPPSATAAQASALMDVGRLQIGSRHGPTAEADCRFPQRNAVR
jgi:hypothetical protein